MRIFGTYELPFDRAKTYQNLHDPAILTRCVPGCEALEKVGEDEYAVSLKLSLPAFSGLFTGKIKITEAKPPQTFKMLVEGTGKVGTVKGEGLLNLSPCGKFTELDYDGDIQVSGAIANVGQRAIDTTAKTMIRKFFEKFIEEVNAHS